MGHSESRRFARHTCRFPCSVRVDEADHRGFVTDLSASGLFVQCAQPLEPGSKLVLTLDTGAAPLVLTGSVARRRKIHRAAQAVDRPGVGVDLESAPEEYFKLVMDLESDRD